MPQVKTVPTEFCKPDPIQAKRHIGTQAHRNLTESVRQHGILQPPGIRPTGETVWGTGRVLAALNAGLKEILVVELHEPMTEAQYQVRTLTENFVRSDLEPIEQVDGVETYANLNPGMPNKEIASLLSIDASMVTRLRAVAACPIAYAALADGRLKGISDAYAVAKAPEDRKSGLLALRQAGATRDVLEAHGRRQQASSAPAVRASKITIALTTGAKVTISGDDLSLDDAIEAVKDATKEMVKGRDQGLDAKTLVAVCRDKAKAG